VIQFAFLLAAWNGDRTYATLTGHSDVPNPDRAAAVLDERASSQLL
jgi:hypothetical protein